MSLYSKVNVQFSALHTLVKDLATLEFKPRFNRNVDLSNGTNSRQADMLYAGQRTLAGNASEDIDVRGAGGATIDDMFGNAFNAVEFVGLIVLADQANQGDIEVGGAATNPFFAGMFNSATAKVKVKPDGAFMVLGPRLNGIGAPVNAASDIIHVHNTHATAQAIYTLIMLGRTAVSVSELVAAAPEEESAASSEEEAEVLLEEKAEATETA